jgi:hypothetical protein
MTHSADCWQWHLDCAVMTVESLRVENERLKTSEGVARIADERRRQIEAEGYTPDHDSEHTFGELAEAAACYIEAARYPEWAATHRLPPTLWPWVGDDWHPAPDPVRNLEKAGALIAAEIDRLVPGECHVEMVSSRVCQRGTKSCVIDHDDKASASGDIQRGN